MAAIVGHEAGLSELQRRQGVHYTPYAVARELVESTLGWWRRCGGVGLPRICDPCCGAGVFLIAAADALVDGGAQPADALRAISGFDVDGLAVKAAVEVTERWYLDRGRSGGQPAARVVEVADTLASPWPAAPYDIVVGNPPFQSQLRTRTARDPAKRSALSDLTSTATRGYVDTAAAYLAVGLTHLAAGGAMCLIQPRSTIAATHAESVRAQLGAAGVVDVWWPTEQVFAASVDVWAPIVVAGATHLGLAPGLVDEQGWRRHLAQRRGLPDLPSIEGSGTVGDAAVVAAGFRDQYYGLVPFVAEADTPADGTGTDATEAPAALVTAGVIEPLELTWGRGTQRFARRRWRRPVVTADAEADGVAGSWVRRQRSPKVLIATQTRVVEAVADPAGATVATTPVVVVWPRSVRPEAVAVALTAPVVSLLMHHVRGGTGLSVDALRISASAVRSLPLPDDGRSWSEAVEMTRSHGWTLAALGVVVDRAYGVDDAAVRRWWEVQLGERAHEPRGPVGAPPLP